MKSMTSQGIAKNLVKLKVVIKLRVYAIMILYHMMSRLGVK